MVDVFLAVVDWFSTFATDILGIGGGAFNAIGSSEIGEALGGTTVDLNGLSSE